VLYHLAHAVVMLVLAIIPRWRPGPWRCFAVGTCLFSGSLYALCLTRVTLFGAITPLGGLAFLAGWLWLAFSKSAS
jgi:uncharacterized membrane protein YgdD (TMEM256/DUF423 family)